MPFHEPYPDPWADLESRSPKFGTLTTKGYFEGTPYKGIYFLYFFLGGLGKPFMNPLYNPKPSQHPNFPLQNPLVKVTDLKNLMDSCVHLMVYSLTYV